MSGRTKKILYNVFSTLFLAAALAGSIVMWWFSPRTIWVAAVAVAVYVVLQPSVLIHEAGHLLVGALCGMKFVSVKLSYLTVERAHGRLHARFSFDGSAGASAFFPKKEAHLKGRLFAVTVGGAALNFLVGAVLFALYFVFGGDVLLFFALFAPLNFCEGLSALIPATLGAGETDGAVLLGLVKKDPEEEVMTAVLRAQSILYRGTFADIPRALLFETPVVREDLPSFTALLLMRMQFLFSCGDDGGAREVFDRLSALAEEMSDEQWGEIARYGDVFEGQFIAEKSPFRGVNELEKMLARHKKSAPGQINEETKKEP